MSNDVSLRDYFATPIMAAAMTQARGLGEVSQEERRRVLLQVAKIAYEAADAMKEAREA